MRLFFAVTLCLALASTSAFDLSAVFHNIGQAFKDTVASTADNLQAVGNALLDQLKGQATTLLQQTTQSLVLNTANALHPDSATATKRSFADLLSNVLAQAGTTVTQYLNQYTNQFHGAFDALNALAGEASHLTPQQLTPLVNGVVDAHHTAVTDLLDNVGHLFTAPSTRRNVFLPELSALQTQLAQSFENPLSALHALVAEAGSHLLNQHGSLATTLLSNFQNQVDQLSQSVSSPEQ